VADALDPTSQVQSELSNAPVKYIDQVNLSFSLYLQTFKLGPQLNGRRDDDLPVPSGYQLSEVLPVPAHDHQSYNSSNGSNSKRSEIDVHETMQPGPRLTEEAAVYGTELHSGLRWQK